LILLQKPSLVTNRCFKAVPLVNLVVSKSGWRKLRS
jgi:hypothetical protein